MEFLTSIHKCKKFCPVIDFSLKRKYNEVRKRFIPNDKGGEGMDNTEIAYQNKDITSKVLAEHFKGKTFRVYGLNIPPIKQALPTNIPAVRANELRLDNLFELADGTLALVDYESAYKKADKIKYLNYLAGIAGRYQKEKKDCPVLCMIVIYTGDIKREQVESSYDIGAVKMNVETAFLSELDAERIFECLKGKVERNERLSDDELMEFIIFPLSYRKKEEKQERIQETVKLAAKIQDKEQQVFTLAGILAFTDKVIDRETANFIRRSIEMTQVAQIFEEEKQQALREEKRQTIRETSRQIVIKMINKNYPTEEIASLVPSYSQNDVEELRMEVAGQRN